MASRTEDFPLSPGPIRQLMPEEMPDKIFDASRNTSFNDTDSCHSTRSLVSLDGVLTPLPRAKLLTCVRPSRQGLLILLRLTSSAAPLSLDTFQPPHVLLHIAPEVQRLSSSTGHRISCILSAIFLPVERCILARVASFTLSLHGAQAETSSAYRPNQDAP